jgi:hypothetical protein
MREITMYVTIKAKVRVVDDTADDDVVDRVATEAKYDLPYEDDVCEVVATELLDASTTCPV